MKSKMGEEEKGMGYEAIGVQGIEEGNHENK